MRVRSLAESDLAFVVANEVRTGSTTWSEAAVRSTLGSPGAAAWVAPDRGHLIARAAADEAEILTLAVAEAHRRQGVATALMEAAAAAWREGAVTRAFLDVRESNTAALGLYEKLGWRVIGRRRKYYRDDQDAICMEWRR